MGHDDHGAPVHQPPHGVQHTLLGPAVEIGGRLVEQQEGRIPQEGPGQRHPLALPRRQARPVVAEHGVEPVGQPGHHPVEAGVGHRGPHLVVGGLGSPKPHVVGHRAGEQVRSLGHPGHLGPPGVGVEVGQVDAAHRHRPPEAGTKPSSTASRVDFPHPLGPAMATTSPGSTAGRPRATPGAAARVADFEPSTREPIGEGSGTSRRGAPGRQRPLEHGEDLLGGLHPLGAGVIVGAEQAQREVGLGGQDEHEEGGGQAEVAAEQPQPHGHGHQGHREVARSSRMSETGTPP